MPETFSPSHPLEKNNLGKLKINGVVVSDNQKIEEDDVKFFIDLFNSHHAVNLCS